MLITIKMDKTEKSGATLKIILAIVITIIVVFCLIAAFALWYGSPDDKILDVIAIEQGYLKNADAFNIEYGIATPEEVDSAASLERAKQGIENALPLLKNMKDNATQVKMLVIASKPKFSGDKLRWFEKVENCYDKRLELIENTEKVLSNEEKYFEYNGYVSQYDDTRKEFEQLTRTYLVYDQANDKINAKKTLNDMKIKVNLMKNQLQKANAAIALPFLNGLIEWTEKYNEVIELTLRYYDSIGSEKSSLESQIINKSKEAGKVFNDANIKIKDDHDSWYNPNITNLRDEINRDFLSANQACDEASAIYGSLFPA